ncbi:MAG TPA: diguanylate cyclase, partial [Acidisoma sp.]|nr:diguanylate cyclase [Acidisoma sp.]
MDDEISSQFIAFQNETPVLVALYDRTDRLRFGNAAFRSAFALGSSEAPLWEEIMRRNLKA